MQKNEYFVSPSLISRLRQRGILLCSGGLIYLLLIIISILNNRSNAFLFFMEFILALSISFLGIVYINKRKNHIIFYPTHLEYYEWGLELRIRWAGVLRVDTTPTKSKKSEQSVLVLREPPIQKINWWHFLILGDRFVQRIPLSQFGDWQINGIRSHIQTFAPHVLKYRFLNSSENLETFDSE